MKGTEAEGKETENSQAEPKRSAPMVSPACVFLTVLFWRALTWKDIWKERPLHAASAISFVLISTFLWPWTDMSYSRKKTLTGNKIFCCIQAYKLISDQHWCLLKNNQKNPIQMPPMISYQLSMYLLWARQKYT